MSAVMSIGRAPARAPLSRNHSDTDSCESSWGVVQTHIPVHDSRARLRWSGVCVSEPRRNEAGRGGCPTGLLAGAIELCFVCGRRWPDPLQPFRRFRRFRPNYRKSMSGETVAYRYHIPVYTGVTGITYR